MSRLRPFKHLASGCCNQGVAEHALRTCPAHIPIPLHAVGEAVGAEADHSKLYESLPGWKQDISAVRKYKDLPKNARAYLDRMATLAGAPISLVGVGPDREQTLEVC